MRPLVRLRIAPPRYALVLKKVSSTCLMDEGNAAVPACPSHSNTLKKNEAVFSEKGVRRRIEKWREIEDLQIPYQMDNCLMKLYAHRPRTCPLKETISKMEEVGDSDYG